MTRTQSNPLVAALSKLDPGAEEHWTEDGQPRLDKLSELLGGDVTREAVIAVSPTFNRTSAKAEKVDPPASAPSLEDLLGLDPTAEEHDDTPEEGSAMSMDLRTVMASPELLVRVIDEIDTKAREMRSRLDEGKAALHQLYAKSEMATRQLDRLQRGMPNGDQKALRDYIAAQGKIREEKARRARKFIEAGTSVDDVVKHLQVKAPIDAALGARKKAPGQGRPVVPLMTPRE